MKNHTNDKVIIDYRSFKSELPWCSVPITEFPFYHRIKRPCDGNADPQLDLKNVNKKQSWSQLATSHIKAGVKVNDIYRQLQSVRLDDIHLAESSNESISSLPVLQPKNDITTSNAKHSIWLNLNNHLTSLPGSLSQICKPRAIYPYGLVNTGNMCYVNTVLQFLFSSSQFFDSILAIGKSYPHSFNSKTPLLDAMILLAREFDDTGAKSESQMIKKPVRTDTIFDAMSSSGLFKEMRRGEQHDAAEFLLLLLDGLHEELLGLQKKCSTYALEDCAKMNLNSQVEEWMSVKKSQKLAIQRINVPCESLINRLFGGSLQTSVQVPGQKDSIVLEPFLSILLDIQDASVSSVEDSITRIPLPESLGEIRTSRGDLASAIKQVHIASLPPLLIFQLKRFIYDNVGGTQKVYKKISIPLRLHIPRNVLASSNLNSYADYHLRSVITHHGCYANGGHYTVDLRAMYGNEWFTIDDTDIDRLQVSGATLDHHFASEATPYVLCYERIETKVQEK